MNPRFLLTFSLILLFLGMILPFMMVIRVIDSSFFLNFFASGASTLGLMLGMVGLAWWTKEPD
ncbi:MAG TPA: hypothetical protein PK414_11025 [Anaerolineales bacterium]|nr:hypothetical protein [Anaerolineales bacterium]HNB36744.1 hypothetical protein [Anaerolineales bacterium]HNC07784.1 hypothetical protein [Anaerolineales bacterium]